MYAAPAGLAPDVFEQVWGLVQLAAEAAGMTAPRDALVSAIHFAEGQTFDRNVVLVTLAPQPAAEPS